MNFRAFLFSILALCATCFPYSMKSQQIVPYKPVQVKFFIGDDVSFSLSKQSEGYQLVVTLTSEERRFLPKAMLWMRTFNNELLELSGTLVDNETRHSMKDQDGSGFPKYYVRSTATFPITREQLSLINHGVMVLRVSTLPMTYDVRFEHDRIGTRLYQLFLQQERTL